MIEFFRDDAAECRNLTNDCRIQRAAGLSVVLRREVNQRAAMEGANQRCSGCPYVHAAREQSLRQIEVGVDLLDFEKINADCRMQTNSLRPISLQQQRHGGSETCRSGVFVRKIAQTNQSSSLLLEMDTY